MKFFSHLYHLLRHSMHDIIKFLNLFTPACKIVQKIYSNYHYHNECTWYQNLVLNSNLFNNVNISSFISISISKKPSSIIGTFLSYQKQKLLNTYRYYRQGTMNEEMFAFDFWFFNRQFSCSGLFRFTQSAIFTWFKCNINGRFLAFLSALLIASDKCQSYNAMHWNPSSFKILSG